MFFRNQTLHLSARRYQIVSLSSHSCASRSFGARIPRGQVNRRHFRADNNNSTGRSPDYLFNNSRAGRAPHFSALIFLSCCFLGLGYSLVQPSNKIRNDAPPPSSSAAVFGQSGQGDISAIWKGVFYPALDLAQATAKLRAEETSTKFTVECDTDVTRLDAIRVPSNHPTEDQKSFVVANVGELEDWKFWGVYDGHAGWATAKILESHLSTYVAQSIRRAKKKQATTLSSEDIDSAVKKAFVDLDDEVMNDGLEALEDKSLTHAEAVSRIAPARAGSCALLAILDPTSATLRVACTGDSRAVLGRRVTEAPSSPSSPSSPISNVSSETEQQQQPVSLHYTAEPLSTDQTGFNPSEVSRHNNLHPNEADAIDPTSGRLLGMAITRAFGDHRWKWPLEAIQKCKSNFYGPSPRPKYTTPPYMTAEPVVTTTKISAGDFLILASDGLWDHMSSEDAVECVGMWISEEKKQKQNKNQNSKIIRSVDDNSSSGEVKNGQRYDYTYRGTPQHFTIEDTNAATHLVRNALGGSRRDLFCSVMTVQPPDSRAVRDDITVQVVFFGD